jgi:hypothetical protein
VTWTCALRGGGSWAAGSGGSGSDPPRCAAMRSIGWWFWCSVHRRQAAGGRRQAAGGEGEGGRGEGRRRRRRQVADGGGSSPACAWSVVAPASQRRASPSRAPALVAAPSACRLVKWRSTAAEVWVRENASVGEGARHGPSAWRADGREARRREGGSRSLGSWDVGSAMQWTSCCMKVSREMS